MTATLPNIVFRNDGTILVKDVRLSYEHVHRPWAKNPDKEPLKYSGKFLMPKATHKAEIAALAQHIMKICQDELKTKLPQSALFLRDGDNEAKPELEGMFVISAKEDVKPKVINRDKTPVTEDMDLIYSGCYVNVLIRPWVQKNVHGKRVNANLLAVQYVRPGERFGGVTRPDVNDVFEDVSESFGGGDDADPFG